MEENSRVHNSGRYETVRLRPKERKCYGPRKHKWFILGLKVEGKETRVKTRKAYKTTVLGIFEKEHAKYVMR